MDIFDESGDFPSAFLAIERAHLAAFDPKHLSPANRDAMVRASINLINRRGEWIGDALRGSGLDPLV